MLDATNKINRRISLQMGGSNRLYDFGEFLVYNYADFLT